MGITNINIICYSDDAILIVETKDALQRFLYKFKNAYKQHNMVHSVAKTKAMTTNTNDTKVENGSQLFRVTKLWFNKQPDNKSKHRE